MPPSKTKTVKNKHATRGSGISNSKNQRAAPHDGIVRKTKDTPKGQKPLKAKGKSGLEALLKKRKKKVYTEAELGIPKLNTIVPAGVEKPKGKKKGKVFVDDRESMNTILAMVQAEKEGQIESKMMKARQMEEIREARRVEAEKKEEERKAKLEDTKDSLRKKRKRTKSGNDAGDTNINDVAVTGSKAVKAKKKKSVSFA
ncbi:60S ribosomal subunit assembly/export protein LOC1 [Colletotrichum sidae]|uniref:60S ribosomal subunit assembly/export protein LOC1 n=4 Tax=Colletotrichum orbiculare species complex TaxID=2707354 RepID=N4V8P5_COLOR|nr:60S ribosomal subunit assembly/export protein LOC1 [Colletotrichum spinosum]TDZ22558.1 60S ribosomal subunit assembly/export protein LOC1 [Colletotrichum orbiculare MAFF 240422]TDZ74105.1 60S ribosomal subunit assembly/export protein LOC1 [Colletotrichum trifolii]TEA17982.1 60S ribosomal subunit assembly/export protein LOC1 [Colletotrichum sidae]